MRRKPRKPEKKRVPIQEQMLKQVLEKLSRTVDTPALIKAVAGDHQCMLACKALVEPTTAADRRTAQRLRRFSQAEGIDLKRLEVRLRPVACALGMAGEATAKPDYYQILGVEQEATTDEVRRAFLKRAREVHPDTADQEQQDSRAFIEVHAAYRTLSNPGMRRRYDDSAACEGPWFENVRPGEADEGTGEKPHPNRRRIVAFSIVLTVLVLLLTAVVFDAVYKQSVLLDGEVVAPGSPEKSVQGKTHPVLSASKDRKRGEEVQKAKEKQRDAPPAEGKRQARGAPFKLAKTDVMEVREVREKIETGQDPPEVKVTPKRTESGPQVSLGHGPDVEQEGLDLMSETFTRAPDEGEKSVNLVQERVDPVPPLKPDVPKIVEAQRTVRMSSAPPAPAVKGPVSVAFSSKKHLDSRITEMAAPPAKVAQTVPGRGISQPDTVAPETPDPIPGGSLLTTMTREKEGREGEVEKGRIQAFLKGYIKAYESRDLESFSGYFTRGAKENGKSFESLLPQYRVYFAQSEEIAYRIDLQQYTVEAGHKLITVQGTFSLEWKPKGKGWTRNSGNISLGLAAVGDDFKVRMLNYEYHEPVKKSVWSGFKWWKR